MSSNRFYTVLVVPEKTSTIKRIMVPSWALKGTLAAGLFLIALAVIMVYDYSYVMSQIDENKSLKIENRRLRQQVQIFNNKIATIESTMDRVKTFATRLKVITNIEDRSGLLQRLNQKLPDAATNIGITPPSIEALEPEQLDSLKTASSSAKATDETSDQAVGPQPATDASDTHASAADSVHSAGHSVGLLGMDPVQAELRRDYERMDERFSRLNYEAFLVEQTLQDQYELLADQKAFLAALPTRKPVKGYFTAGFGVRSDPFSGRAKMHEGLDIANHAGTPIFAPSSGVVKFAAVKSGYGQTVVLDHGYGLETWYAHTRTMLVRRGQKVRRGDKIALVGTTGRSTGPHCHYEVRVHGTPVDPLSYILEN